MPGAITEVLNGETLQVAQWRIERFDALGFTPDQADLLAHGSTDWHEAAVLVSAGCPLELAFRLLT